MSKGERRKYNKLWKKEWKSLHKIGPGLRTKNRILLKLFKKYTHKGSVVDVGCGDGTFLDLLHNHYSDTLSYEGTDISNEALALAKNFEFIQKIYLTDIVDKSSFPKKKYDVVVSSEVLEHIKNWKLGLRNMIDILENGGLIFITVPHGMKYWGPHDEFAKHYRRFEKGEIEKELERLGLEIEESICWGWPIYWLYYTFVLNKSDPKSAMKDIKSPLKVILSNLLYVLFHIDDLFNTIKGRRLFIVAWKTG